MLLLSRKGGAVGRCAQTPGLDELRSFMPDELRAIALVDESGRESIVVRDARGSSRARACKEPPGTSAAVRQRERCPVRRSADGAAQRAGHLLRGVARQARAEQLCEQFVGGVDAFGVFERVEIHQEPAYHGERERC